MEGNIQKESSCDDLGLSSKELFLCSEDKKTEQRVRRETEYARTNRRRPPR